MKVVWGCLAVAQYGAMSDYIDVLEAVNLTGKSLSTVRRTIKGLPPDTVKKVGGKHLYRRDVLFRELGVEVQPEPPVEVQMNVHEPPMDVQQKLIETLEKQVAEQQKVIAQLLDRQRETNILLNNYQQKMLTVNEPPERSQGKSPAEIRREQWIAIACIALLVLILCLAIYFSWHR